jgi:hypothetical protein
MALNRISNRTVKDAVPGNLSGAVPSTALTNLDFYQVSEIKLSAPKSAKFRRTNYCRSRFPRMIKHLQTAI